jgi:hypothetical protein
MQVRDALTQAVDADLVLPGAVLDALSPHRSPGDGQKKRNEGSGEDIIEVDGSEEGASRIRDSTSSEKENAGDDGSEIPSGVAYVSVVFFTMCRVNR